MAWSTNMKSESLTASRVYLQSGVEVQDSKVDEADVIYNPWRNNFVSSGVVQCKGGKNGDIEVRAQA